MARDLLGRAVGIVSLLGASLICARSARGHDSWLVASQNSLPEPGTVRVAFCTAEQFPDSAYATKPQRVAEWFVRSGRSTHPVKDYAIERLELAAEVSLEAARMYVVAVRLHPHFIEFEADHFNGYLKEEQAQEALAIRERAGQTDQPGRMYYTKLVKTFVQVGRQPTGYYQRPVGHELEIIPLSNPCRWQEGEQVTVRVLYKGRPAANMRVSSGHKGLPHDTFAETVFTDSAGMARLMLTRPGLWFLRAHLIRPLSRTNERAAHKPQADKPQADWESFWSSLTFRVHDQLGE